MKNNKENELTIEDLEMIFANPFYCINIAPIMASEHETLVSEETWIECAIKTIKEDKDNGKKFLTYLLKNLKGNYVS